MGLLVMMHWDFVLENDFNDILNRKYKVDVDGVIKEIELGCDKCKK